MVCINSMYVCIRQVGVVSSFPYVHKATTIASLGCSVNPIWEFQSLDYDSYRNYLIKVFSFEWSLDPNSFTLLAIFYFIPFVIFLSEEWKAFLIFALCFHIADVIIFKDLIEKLELHG